MTFLREIPIMQIDSKNLLRTFEFSVQDNAQKPSFTTRNPLSFLPGNHQPLIFGKPQTLFAEADRGGNTPPKPVTQLPLPNITISFITQLLASLY